jgi:hypothetical protein
MLTITVQRSGRLRTAGARFTPAGSTQPSSCAGHSLDASTDNLVSAADISG